MIKMLRLAYCIFLFFVSNINSGISIGTKSGDKGEHTAGGACYKSSDYYTCCVNQSKEEQDVFARAKKLEECIDLSINKKIDIPQNIFAFMQQESVLNGIKSAVDATYSAAFNSSNGFCSLIGKNNPSCSDRYKPTAISDQQSENSPNSTSLCTPGAYYNYFLDTVFQKDKAFFSLCPGMFVYLINELLKDGKCSSVNDGVCGEIYNLFVDSFKANLYNYKNSSLNNSFNNNNTNTQRFYKLFKQYPKALFQYALYPFILIAQSADSILAKGIGITYSPSLGSISPFTPLFTPINSQSGSMWLNLDEKLQSKLTSLLDDIKEQIKFVNALTTISQKNLNYSSGFQLANISYFNSNTSTILNNKDVHCMWTYYAGCFNFTQIPSVSFKNITRVKPIPSENSSSNWPTPQNFDNRPYSGSIFPVKDSKNSSNINIGRSFLNFVMGEPITTTLLESGTPSVYNSIQETIESAQQSGSFSSKYPPNNGLYPRIYSCCGNSSSSSSSGESSLGNRYLCELYSDMYCLYDNLYKNMKFKYALQDYNVEKVVSKRCSENNIESNFKSCMQNYAQNSLSICKNNGNCSGPQDNSQECLTCLKNEFEDKCGNQSEKMSSCVSTIFGTSKEFKKSFNTCKSKNKCSSSFDLSENCQDCVKSEICTNNDQQCITNVEDSFNIKKMFKLLNDSYTALTMSQVTYYNFIYKNSFNKSTLPTLKKSCDLDKDGNCTIGKNEMCICTKHLGEKDWSLSYKFIKGWSKYSNVLNNQSSILTNMIKKIYKKCPKDVHISKLQEVMSILGYIMIPVGVIMAVVSFDPAMIVMMLGMMGGQTGISKGFEVAENQFEAISQSKIFQANFLGKEDQF